MSVGAMLALAYPERIAKNRGGAAGLIPAGEWPRRHDRSRLAAGARAVSRRGRADRQRGARPYPLGRADRARRDRGALCRPHRVTRGDHIRCREHELARAQQPAARRHRAVGPADAGRAERRNRATTRRRDCQTRRSTGCRGPKRSGNGATASCSCAAAKATAGPICPTQRLRKPRANGWRRRSPRKPRLPNSARMTLSRPCTTFCHGRRSGARRRGADPFRGADRLAGADRLRSRGRPENRDPGAGIVRSESPSRRSPAAGFRC